MRKCEKAGVCSLCRPLLWLTIQVQYSYMCCGVAKSKVFSVFCFQSVPTFFKFGFISTTRIELLPCMIHAWNIAHPDISSRLTGTAETTRNNEKAGACRDHENAAVGACSLGSPLLSLTESACQLRLGSGPWLFYLEKIDACLLRPVLRVYAKAPTFAVCVRWGWTDAGTGTAETTKKLLTGFAAAVTDQICRPTATRIRPLASWLIENCHLTCSDLCCCVCTMRLPPLLCVYVEAEPTCAGAETEAAEAAETVVGSACSLHLPLLWLTRFAGELQF